MHCGRPLLEEQDEFCMDCIERKNSCIEQGIIMWEYDEPMQASIAKFKYGGYGELARDYAERICKKYKKTIKGWNPTLILSVPMYKKKIRYRGYNQAALLATEISKILHIPYSEELLIRNRETKPQSGLNKKERTKNLRHAFSVSKKEWEQKSRPQKILIIDDLYTTGSTIEECAAMLKLAGAKKIYFLAACTSTNV